MAIIGASIYFGWYVPHKETAEAEQVANIEAERRWNEIKVSSNITDLWNFVQKFGATTYAAQARAHLVDMEPLIWPVIQKAIARDIIRMEACRAAWNQRIDNESNTGIDHGSWKVWKPEGVPYVMGGLPGLRFSYHSDAVTGDVCGWYFIPNGSSTIEKLASKAQASVIDESTNDFEMVAQGITQLVPENGEFSEVLEKGHIDDDVGVFSAIDSYGRLIDEKISKIAGIDNITKLNSMIVTNTDELFSYGKDHKFDVVDFISGHNSQEALELRKRVSVDLSNFGD